MKREILCFECRDKLKGLYPSDNPYPDEFVKFVDGLSKIGFNCDGCNRQLKPGSDVCALSIWTTRQGIQYYPWEEQLIILKSGGGDVK